MVFCSCVVFSESNSAIDNSAIYNRAIHNRAIHNSTNWLPSPAYPNSPHSYESSGYIGGDDAEPFDDQFRPGSIIIDPELWLAQVLSRSGDARSGDKRLSDDPMLTKSVIAGAMGGGGADHSEEDGRASKKKKKKKKKKAHQQQGGGSAEGNNGIPEGGAQQILSSDTILCIEIILHRRYCQRRNINDVLWTATVIVTHFQELSKKPDAELQAILLKYAEEGDLHAMLILALHRLSGIFTYDPALAGEWLRRIQHRVSHEPELAEKIQSFCDTRQLVILNINSYQILMVSLLIFKLASDPNADSGESRIALLDQVGSHPVFMRTVARPAMVARAPELSGRYVIIREEDDAIALTTIAMAFEASAVSMADYQNLFRLLQRATDDSASFSPTEHQAIRICSSDDQTKKIYRGWLLFYLGRYVQEYKIINVTSEGIAVYRQLLDHYGVTYTRNVYGDSYALRTPPSDYFDKAANCGCEAAMCAFIARQVGLWHDPVYEDKRAIIKDGLGKYVTLLVSTLGDNFLDYVRQMSLDIRYGVAYAFYRSKQKDQYRTILSGVNKDIIADLAIQYGAVPTDPKKAVEWYLDAIKRGSSMAERKLKSLLACHAELLPMIAPDIAINVPEHEPEYGDEVLEGVIKVLQKLVFDLRNEH